MKKVVLSGSIKFKEIIENTLTQLQQLWVPASFPNIDSICEGQLTKEQSYSLAQDHYEAIKKADRVYFIVPKGYMGTSCKLELWYAVALNKEIYFSEPTHDIALDCYTKCIISSNELSFFTQ